jgi:hypothetical protein
MQITLFFQLQHCFSLTTNQQTVLSAMTFQRNEWTLPGHSNTVYSTSSGNYIALEPQLRAPSNKIRKYARHMHAGTSVYFETLNRERRH